MTCVEAMAADSFTSFNASLLRQSKQSVSAKFE